MGREGGPGRASGGSRARMCAGARPRRGFCGAPSPPLERAPQEAGQRHVIAVAFGRPRGGPAAATRTAACRASVKTQLSIPAAGEMMGAKSRAPAVSWGGDCAGVLRAEASGHYCTGR